MSNTLRCVYINDIKNSFVKIPSNIYQKLIENNYGLCLKWYNNDNNEQNTAFVSYSNQVLNNNNSIIQVPYALAKCLDIEEGTLIDVSIAMGSGIIDGPIYIEPASVDDWEILQLNAEYVESNLLEQINIITCHKTFPFYIRSILIHLRVVSSTSHGWCRLLPQSEIAIAPMLRKRSHNVKEAEELKRNQIFKWRIEPFPLNYNESLNEWPSRVIFANPINYNQINKLWKDENHMPIVQIHLQISNINSDKDNNQKNDENGLKEICEIFTLVSSPFCTVNHIMISNACRYHYGVILGSIAYIHLVKRTFLRKIHSTVNEVPTIYLKPVAWNYQYYEEKPNRILNNIYDQTLEKWNDQQLYTAMSTWLNEFRDNGIQQLKNPKEAQKYPFFIPFRQNCIITLKHPINQKVTYFIIEKQIDQIAKENNDNNNMDDMINNNKEDDDDKLIFNIRIAPKNRLRQREKLPVTVSLQKCSFVNKKLDSLTSILMKCNLINKNEIDCEKMNPLRYLVGINESLDYLKSHMEIHLNKEKIENLVKDNIIKGGHCTSSIVICGNKGVGKTSVLAAISYYCRYYIAKTTYIEWLNCRDLASATSNKIISTIKNCIKKAVFNAPSIIILDDLDRIAPKPDESDQNPASIRNQIVSETIADLILTAQNLALTNAIPFIVLASSTSYNDLNESLRVSGLFVDFINLKAPDLNTRIEMIQSMLKRFPVNIDDDIEYRDIALQLEGYVGRDIYRVLLRAVHFFIGEQSCNKNDYTNLEYNNSNNNNNNEFDKEKNEIMPTQVLTSDYIEQSLVDFVPAALQKLSLTKSNTSWNDIGGLHQVRQMIRDTFDLPTRYAALFNNLPIKLRCGLLLYGPPGCGKTLIANAVAGECSLNFISVKGPELLNKYIGASEENVRQMFERAAAAAPCILFFDEFESIAPKRGGETTGVTDRVVNQLLTQLDGVEGREGVYILAASSRPDLIDPALLRPGRLDKSLYCGYPDTTDRLEILQSRSRHMKLTDKAKKYLSFIAQSTEFYSGADLQGILTSAQVKSVHDWINVAEESSNQIDTENVGIVDDTHLEAAYKLSAPSTSKRDQQKFQSIYDRFIQTRENSSSTNVFDPNAKQRFISA